MSEGKQCYCSLSRRARSSYEQRRRCICRFACELPRRQAWLTKKHKSARVVVLVAVLQGWASVTLGHDISLIHLEVRSHEESRGCLSPWIPLNRVHGILQLTGNSPRRPQQPGRNAVY